MQKPQEYSIVIAHKSILLCEVLREALQNRKYQVNVFTTNGEDVLGCIKAHRPDVVIMSNDLPNVSGVEVVNETKTLGIESKFMFLSQNESEAQFLQRFVSVEGHLHAWVKMGEFFYCLQEIVSGRTYVSATIEKFIQELPTENNEISYDPTVLKILTPREKEIMKALSKSYTTPKIADLFFISTATVNNHRAKIIDKLNLKGRNQLLTMALSLRPYFG